MFSARNTSLPMPSPSCTVMPGARNLSGASRNEMASTMPHQRKIEAVASSVMRPTLYNL
jgi:hypothetical protein